MFAGVMSFEASLQPGAVADAAAWRAALAPCHQPDLEGTWRSGPALLTHTRVFNGPATRDVRVPLVCPATGVALAFWGRLDNRAALIAQLGQADGVTGEATDGEVVLAAWRRWGEGLPERLLGDFALAVMDPARREVFLARDAVGVKPLYYLASEDVFAFATTVAALRVLRDRPLTPDDDWMARYLVDLSRSHDRTGYREVLKLPAACSLVVRRGAGGELRRWHGWRDDPPPASRRDERWVKAYREVLDEAIRCRMTSDFPLGTENSGGLDSATITVFLAHFLDDPDDRLYDFGFALGEEEPALILASRRAAGISHNFTIDGGAGLDDGESRVERDLRVLGYPPELVNATSHYPFYEECEAQGIRTLFSGFGGDEAGTHHAVHLRWELLDEGRYRALWDLLPGRPVRRTLRFGKAVTIGRSKPSANPELVAALSDRWPLGLVRPEIAERLGLYEEHMESARYDGPYRRINDFLLQHLLTASYVPTRLENCTLVAASYGVEYRWPLWDVRLVQQYLSTPSVEKRGPDELGRYLHRRAVSDLVPAEIAWRRGKVMDFSRQLEALRTTRLAEIVDRVGLLEPDLHPSLDALIDRDNLRRQTQRAAQGSRDDNFVNTFRHSVRKLTWLNAWLHGMDQ